MRMIAAVASFLWLTGAWADPQVRAASPGLSTSASLPRPVTVARATVIPRCAKYVDAAATGAERGTAARPFKTIGAAVTAAAPGAVICVAEGNYPETLRPGTKYFTLAGGFKHGASFKVRDSAVYVSRAVGKGGSFLRIEDPSPSQDQLTAVDGFEITGYAQAIYRNVWYSQRLDITNNNIHDNRCSDPGQIGGGFSLNNVSGLIRGNVIANNACSRGGGGALGDSTHSRP